MLCFSSASDKFKLKVPIYDHIIIIILSVAAFVFFFCITFISWIVLKMNCKKFLSFHAVKVQQRQTDVNIISVIFTITGADDIIDCTGFHSRKYTQIQNSTLTQNTTLKSTFVCHITSSYLEYS